MKNIRWFTEIRLADSGQVGGKGSNLGELTRAGLPVPPGFCVTSFAYQAFLHSTGLDRQIQDLLVEIDLADRDDIARKSTQIQAAIQAQTIPPELCDEIEHARLALIQEQNLPAGQELRFAVRPSATAEDQANLPDSWKPI